MERSISTIALLGALLSLPFLADARAAGRPMAASNCSEADVPQGHYLIASAAERVSIASRGASTCVLLTLFDPSTRIGAMAHVSASVDVEKSLQAILREMRKKGARLERLEANLVGGLAGFSELMVADLNRSLKARKISLASQETLYNPMKACDALLEGQPPAAGGGPAGACAREAAGSGPIKSILLNLASGALLDLPLERPMNKQTCPDAFQGSHPEYPPLIKGDF